MPADLDAELGGQHHAVTMRGQHPADERLVVAVAVGVGGVEERDAQVDRPAQDRDHVLAAAGVLAVAHGHAHRAQPDHEAALAEVAVTPSTAWSMPGSRELSS